MKGKAAPLDRHVATLLAMTAVLGNLRSVSSAARHPPTLNFVIPAQAGMTAQRNLLDARFRGHDMAAGMTRRQL
jgi:hypothetical protein